jgi:plasmid stabilization system protein ParE
MPKKIEYLDGAKLDFNEAFDWYAERSAKAARGFAFAIDDAFERISLILVDSRLFAAVAATVL